MTKSLAEIRAHFPALTRELALRGIFVSHGSFYASGVMARLGFGRAGLVRAGCACYTSEAEIDRLIGQMARVASGTK